MRSGLLTDKSPDFGRPGTYELYRSGGMDAPNGMIFLSASPAETSKYVHEEDGRTTFEQYQVNIKNPLVVSEDTDRNNVIAAWKALHPGEDPKIKTSGLPAKKWQQMDKQNAKALENSEYDAIIYKKANGRHEVQIPKSSGSSLKKTNSYDSKGMFHNDTTNEYFRFVRGPAKGKDGGGKTTYRVDRQYYKFDRKKGFVKTRFAEGS